MSVTSKNEAQDQGKHQDILGTVNQLLFHVEVGGSIKQQNKQ